MMTVITEIKRTIYLHALGTTCQCTNNHQITIYENFIKSAYIFVFFCVSTYCISYADWKIITIV